MSWQSKEVFDLESGRVSVQDVAKFLKMDCQTVRVLLQNGAVDWGIAFKPPGSKHYNYIIYAKRFEEVTGYKAI